MSNSSLYGKQYTIPATLLDELKKYAGSNQTINNLLGTGSISYNLMKKLISTKENVPPSCLKWFNEKLKSERAKVDSMKNLNKNTQYNINKLAGMSIGIDMSPGTTATITASVNPKTIIITESQYKVLLEEFDFEEVHKHSRGSKKVMDILGHFTTQKDYIGPEWAGVELLNFKLATHFENVHIESGGWYRYHTSKRRDMDGKDWRLVITDLDPFVSVNCHSLLHDNVWTLSTTIFDTKQIAKTKVKPISDEDIWKRSMKWTIKTAEVLQTHGYNYTKSIKDMKKRLKSVDKIHKLVDENKIKISKILGKHKIPKTLTIGINTWGLKKGKIGALHTINKGKKEIGYMCIHPKALGDLEYLDIVVKHELAHAALRQTHTKKFKDLLEKLEVPKRYWD